LQAGEGVREDVPFLSRRAVREAEHGLYEGDRFGFGDVLDAAEGKSLGKVGAVIVALGGKNA
jgi:hypothetical protein